MLRALWPFTLRGTLALGAGVACVVLGVAARASIILTLGIGLVLLVLASLVILWVRPIASSVTRTVPAAVVAAGTTVRVRLRVDIGERRTATITWREGTAADGTAGNGVVEPDDSGVARVAHDARPLRRGLIRLGPLWLTARDALGVAKRTQPIAVMTDLLVGPAIVPLAETRVLTAGGAGGRPVTSYSGDGADDLIPRPYQQGDSRRRVHWKATAHRGELMVRQEEQEAAPNATVIVDRTQAAPHAAGFEEMMSAVASVAAHFAKAGYTVDVLDTDGSTMAARIGADLSPLLSVLALAEPRVPDAIRARPPLRDGALGPTAIVCGDQPVRLTNELSDVHRRGRVVALLCFAPPAMRATLADAGWRPGGLADGVSQAWTEAVSYDA